MRLDRITREESAVKLTIESDAAIQKLAQEALDIQNACNLCGLAQRFAQVMIELGRCPQSRGTGWANQNPITRGWIDKFLSLVCLTQEFENTTYQQLYALARGEDIEIEVL
jgi:hypothetical protein